MDYKTIEVKGSGGVIHYAIVEPQDFEFLNQFKWRLSDRGYARREVQIHGKTYVRYMHRIVIDVPDSDELEGDHVNGNRLDNRRANLRIVNGDQNARNRFAQAGKAGGVKFKGVFANKWCSTFTARIRVGKKSVYIGSFADQLEAARAYDAEAIKLHGEHAKLNFPAAACQGTGDDPASLTSPGEAGKV